MYKETAALRDFAPPYMTRGRSTSSAFQGIDKITHQDICAVADGIKARSRARSEKHSHLLQLVRSCFSGGAPLARESGQKETSLGAQSLGQ
jgi:hypothetical protein